MPWPTLGLVYRITMVDLVRQLIWCNDWGAPPVRNMSTKKRHCTSLRYCTPIAFIVRTTGTLNIKSDCILIFNTIVHYILGHSGTYASHARQQSRGLVPGRYLTIVVLCVKCTWRPKMLGRLIYLSLIHI